jgi:cytoskeletal protein CcmA (bactofilin family)
MPFGKDNLVREHLAQDDISGFLAEGTEIKGEIRFRDILRVDGKVSGKVLSEGELVVGEAGEVEADIEVGTLSVSGRVTGTLHVREKMVIHSKGRVAGDLTIDKPNLMIHEGAIFEGDVDMNSGAKKEAPDDPIPQGADIEPLRRPGA